MSSEPQVEHLVECRMVVADEPWLFALGHQAAIAAHWVAARAANPSLFDGEMFVVKDCAVSATSMRATLLRTRFSAYHYWRHVGFDAGVTQEAFATTVVRSNDGGVLLARSVAGTLNEGLFASPGGLFDGHDLDANGAIDVAAAAARELEEETGLSTMRMERVDGFLLVRVPPFLALASVFRTSFSATELLSKVNTFLDLAQAPELEAPLIVRTPDELRELAMAPHARLLTEYVLA